MNAKEIIGHKVGPLPLGAWVLIGVGSVAAVYYIRQRQSGGGASTIPGPVAAPAAGSQDPLTLALEDLSASIGQIGSSGNPGGPVPPVNAPSGLGSWIPPDLAQWVWNGSGWLPNPNNLPAGWAWGQSGAYTLSGGPAAGHFVWTPGGWIPNPSSPPPDWAQSIGSVVTTPTTPNVAHPIFPPGLVEGEMLGRRQVPA
jgi:hypothetical protein